MCKNTPGALEIPSLFSASTKFIYRAIWKTVALHLQDTMEIFGIVASTKLSKNTLTTEIVNHNQTSGIFVCVYVFKEY